MTFSPVQSCSPHSSADNLSYVNLARSEAPLLAPPRRTYKALNLQFEPVRCMSLGIR